jgi:hypothetical protein
MGKSYRLQYRDTINTLIGPNFMALSYWSDITFQNRFYRDVQNISYLEYFQCEYNFFTFPIERRRFFSELKICKNFITFYLRVRPILAETEFLVPDRGI